MGRKRIHSSPAARMRALRARQRAAEGKPEPLTEAQKRAADRREDAANVADIRAMLVKRGRTDLADRMYPQGHRAPESYI